MSQVDDIRQALRKTTHRDLPYGVVCTVDNINLTDMTCDCTPLDDTADFLGVRLMAQAENGFLLVPKDGSVVVVQPINKATGYISMVSEIDEVIMYIDASNKVEFDSTSFRFNGGALDGMVKVNDLVAKLNIIEEDLNDIKSAVLNWTPVANDGGAALKLALATWYAATIMQTDKADLENTKVKQ